MTGKTEYVKVYFVHLSDDLYNAINAGGWGCEAGRNYHDAKDGNYTDPAKALFQHAATVRDGRMTNEAVWQRLQNLREAWSEGAGSIECHTDFPRSMDVGDVIVHYGPDDKPITAVRCARVGFEAIDWTPGVPAA